MKTFTSFQKRQRKEAFLSMKIQFAGCLKNKKRKIADKIWDKISKRAPFFGVVGLSNICYTPINKFPQNSLW